MLKGEQGYLEILKELVDKAESTDPVLDRTGVGTWKLFHRTLRFDLKNGFPLLTTKFVSLKSVVGELLWFIEGNTNAKYLEDKYGCTIWREWADEDGELGETYGYMWRDFGGYESEYEHNDRCYTEWVNGFDQLKWLINEIKTNPNSRRLYVTAANPLSRYNQALDCCHNYFQVVIEDNKLNLYFQMRSTDVFLGLPYNLASYGVLLYMLAIETGYDVGELVYSGVDVHLYKNHLDQAKLQLSRDVYESPYIEIKKKSFFEYSQDDFNICNYIHHPAIKADVAV